MAKRAPSALKHLDNSSLADRAHDEILQAIIDKRFERRLPSEDELAVMLNVSRTTIRSSLQRLEQDGIINRRRAIGTTINAHVAPASLALQRLVGFDQMLEERGHEVVANISWKRAKPSSELVRSFGIDPGADCCIMLKVYLADGQAAIQICDIVPWSHLNAKHLEESIPASMFEFSSQYLKEQIDHALVNIVPMVNEKTGVTRLPLRLGQPFVRLHETHYSVDGDPLAFSVIDQDPDLIQLEVFRRR